MDSRVHQCYHLYSSYASQYLFHWIKDQIRKSSYLIDISGCRDTDSRLWIRVCSLVGRYMGVYWSTIDRKSEFNDFVYHIFMKQEYIMINVVCCHKKENQVKFFATANNSSYIMVLLYNFANSKIAILFWYNFFPLDYFFVNGYLFPISHQHRFFYRYLCNILSLLISWTNFYSSDFNQTFPGTPCGPHVHHKARLCGDQWGQLPCDHTIPGEDYISVPNIEWTAIEAQLQPVLLHPIGSHFCSIYKSSKCLGTQSDSKLIRLNLS